MTVSSNEESDQLHNGFDSPDEIAVRVAVRVRPLVPKEQLEQCRTCVRSFPREGQVVVGKDRAFSFDFVFNEQSSQKQVFDDACLPLVQRCFQGYNATVFAYGQTGSGKTFTMGSTTNATQEELGVVPRVVNQVFEELHRGEQEGGEFTVRISYLEIYNEEVKDLLHPRTPSKTISIREDRAGDIFVLGVREVEVRTRDELLRLLETGAANRTTGSTLMNEMSSRSHSLFTVMMERRVRAGADVVTSKFHLVDLAGSERNKKTGTAGQRFKESVTINQGLLALGNVISALGDESRRASLHVPYRESKLTRLLQDSLGGNSHTLMIACVGPADSNLDETLNTLRYANRARNIRNTPIINRETPSVVDLRHEIESLQWQLQQQATNALPSVPTISEAVAGNDSPPLSRRVLEVLRAELPSLQLQQLVGALKEVDVNAPVTPILSPAVTPAASPSRAAAITPARDASTSTAKKLGGAVRQVQSKSALARLRHTLQQWGRSEAQRAQLLRQLPQQPAEIGTEAGDEGALSVHGALRRSTERGQLLQTLGLSQFEEIEAEMERQLEQRVAERVAAIAPSAVAYDNCGGDEAGRPSTAPSNGYIREGAEASDSKAGQVALRAMLAVREKELADVRSELAEAQADLLRDEQIFTEKLRELKHLKKAHSNLQREHAVLQEQWAAERDRVTAMEMALPTAPPHPPMPHTPSAATSIPHTPSPAPSAPHTPSAAPSILHTPSVTPSMPDTPSATPSGAQTWASANRGSLPPSGKGGGDGAESSQVSTGAGTCSPASCLSHARGAEGGESSVRLACSPSCAYAERLEALDEVVMEDGALSRNVDAPAPASSDTPIHSRLPAPTPHRTREEGLAMGAQAAAGERAQLESEQHALRSQWDAAEAQAEALTMDFEATQQRLEASVRDLTLNIRLKEELIRDLSRSEEECRNAASSYQQKLLAMSSEITALQEQLTKTRHEMESAEKQADRSEEEKRRLRAAYEKRLRETDAHLSEVRRRQREQERALRSRDQAEKKIGELRAEVVRMRGQQGGLEAAIKESKIEFERMRVEREREAASLRRGYEESVRTVRALEVANARQEVLLQRKSEQVSIAQQKLKEAQAAPAEKQQAERAAERQRAAERAAARAARRGRGSGALGKTGGEGGGSKDVEDGSGRPSTAPASTEEAQAAVSLAAIEKQEEALLARGEAARALERELARREAILAEREALIESRGKLEVSQLRASHSLRASIGSLSRRLHEIDSALERGGSHDEAMPGAAPTAALLQQRGEVQDQLALLEARGEHGGAELLDEAARRELQLLDEQLDGLSAQLDFKDIAIGELEEAAAALSSAPAGETLIEQLNHMSLPVARRVLQTNVTRLLQLREESREREREVDALRLSVHDKAEEVDSLRQALARVALDHEKQLLEHQQGAKLEIQQAVEAALSEARQVTSNLAPPAPPEGASRRDSPGSQHATGGREVSSPHEALEQLGRDNFYYKITNRELKRRLREAEQSLEGNRNQLLTALQQAREEERLNAELKGEIKNLKHYLAQHPGATPTRVSKSTLSQMREILPSSVCS